VNGPGALQRVHGVERPGQYEVDFKNLFFRQETTVIPRNRERSTADGLAIVA
jgi:hypothetical protein